jgi:hypothetical protein
MLADGGLGQRKDIDNVAANTLINLLKIIDDFESGRVGQGFAQDGKGFLYSG